MNPTVWCIYSDECDNNDCRHKGFHKYDSAACAPGRDCTPHYGTPYRRVDGVMPTAHLPGCAIALNARHACSCGLNKELGAKKPDEST